MNTPAFGTPIQLKRELSKRAQQAAAKAGVPSGDLWGRWFLERLLARVFTHDPDGWLLKGGLAMLVRHPGARHSRDLDLLHHSATADLDEAVTALLDAASVPGSDTVRFEHLSTSGGPTVAEAHAAAGRPCRSVKFAPYLANKQHNTITVDLIADMDPLGAPVSQPLEPLFGLHFGDVELRLLSLEDHLADKTCAIYERRQGIPSSRIKDLVDLVYVAASDSVDGHLFTQAISKEVARRRVNGTDIDLPAEFTVPDPRSWSSGYRKAASTVDGLDELRTFDAAVELADQFLTPVLRGDHLGHWNPKHRTWNPA